MRLDTGWKRFITPLIVIVIAIPLGGSIIKPWLARMGLEELPTREGLSRAISYDPQKPSYHYLLGLYWQYDPLERDLNKARLSYLTAIGLNPVDGRYWIELANVYKGLGDFTRERASLNRAYILNPTDLRTRWGMINLSLRQGEMDSVLAGFKGVIKDYPGERQKAFSLLHLITEGNVGYILERAIPEGMEAVTAYLYFLMDRGDTGGVKLLWKTLPKGLDIAPSLMMRYIGYLISHGEIKDAREEWVRYKGVGNGLIWNGSFEGEVGNWGFDWRVGKVEGVTVDVDSKVFFKGNHSLRIEFDGRHNVDFQHISQIIPLGPETRYTLSAGMMTKGITTTNGIFMEFYGINGCSFYGRTDPIRGTNPWGELRIEVKTPSNCNAGVVRLRRERSTKLDNLIGGKVWIDGVELTKDG